MPREPAAADQSLFAWAQNQYWPPQRQDVSIGNHVAGDESGFVPGKRRANQTADHSLWKNKQQTWRQTNVVTHINTVVNSGRVNEIRALKIRRLSPIADRFQRKY